MSKKIIDITEIKEIKEIKEKKEKKEKYIAIKTKRIYFNGTFDLIKNQEIPIGIKNQGEKLLKNLLKNNYIKKQ